MNDMYGPIKIGGPCTKCGRHHPSHQSCEDAKREQEASVGELVKRAFAKLGEIGDPLEGG